MQDNGFHHFKWDQNTGVLHYRNHDGTCPHTLSEYIAGKDAFKCQNPGCGHEWRMVAGNWSPARTSGDPT